MGSDRTSSWRYSSIREEPMKGSLVHEEEITLRDINNNDKDQGIDGGRVRVLRQSRGISARELAKKIDIDVQHLYRVERGAANPSNALLVKIAKFFNLSPSYFTDHISEEEFENVINEENNLYENDGEGGELSSESYDQDVLNNRISERSIHLNAKITARTFISTLSEDTICKLSIGESFTFEIPSGILENILIEYFNYHIQNNKSK